MSSAKTSTIKTSYSSSVLLQKSQKEEDAKKNSQIPSEKEVSPHELSVPGIGNSYLGKHTNRYLFLSVPSCVVVYPLPSKYLWNFRLKIT